MREKATAKDGQVNPMPPQIFSDDEYLGVSYSIINSSLINLWIYGDVPQLNLSKLKTVNPTFNANELH